MQAKIKTIKDSVKNLENDLAKLRDMKTIIVKT